jgi:ABC-type antimicrobial peptide transport system permease subunit
MRRIPFYFKHAISHLWHSGHWTAFAVFCVAAGVATVVALRSLGLSITDSLVSNLRQYNHGDINISSVANFGPFTATFQRGADEPSVFRDWQLDQVRGWASRYNALLSPYTLVSNVQITPLNASGAGRPQFTSSFLIDPLTFDQAAPILALDPAGVPLRDLFTGGYEIVISQNLAESQRLGLGDPVRVSGTEQPFSVVGIVATETEASINNILAAFFGFAYFDLGQAGTLGLNPQPNHIGIILPDGTTADEIERLAAELWSVIPIRDMNATPWLLRRNEFISDTLSRFIVAMGLGALLIGGVGIMNTMLVLVRRRTMEVAALKTFGLKAGQIAAVFLTEAFLLGILGSIAGVIAGLLLSGVVNGYGEAFLQQRIPWRVHPEALAYGITLGMVVTMVFGVLPIFTAARIRPAIILRPNEIIIPRAGLAYGLLALGVIVGVLGIVAGQIVGPVLETVTDGRAPPSALVGIVVVGLTVLILGLLVGVMWIVVWIVGRLPALGQVDLRLALRNLSTHRLRTATTLLALTAGMFALSSITYFGLGAREIVRFQFAQTLGGNVMIVPLLPNDIAQQVVNLAIAAQPGVESTTQLNLNLARITRVNGERILIDDAERTLPLTILTRDTDNVALGSGTLLAGRDLTPEDRGQPVIVLAEQTSLESVVEGYESLEEIGIAVGSTIRLRVGRENIDFEVVGIVGNSNGFTPSPANAYVPPGAPGMARDYRLTMVQVAPESIDTFLTNMTAIPLIFALDVSFIDGLLKRIIDQLASIPTLVGILSLSAAAVIMGNTVALTILERRQQIGILKALGLQRGRVLRVILLENTLIGLLGGLLGIGISSLGVSLLTLLGAGSAIPLPSDALFITLGLIAASVLIAWAATLLSARIAIREQVARILRYE